MRGPPRPHPLSYTNTYTDQVFSTMRQPATVPPVYTHCYNIVIFRDLIPQLSNNEELLQASKAIGVGYDDLMTAEAPPADHMPYLPCGTSATHNVKKFDCSAF
jgi:hypothetical protein